MPIVPGEFNQSVMPQGQGIYNTIDKASPDNFGGQVGQTLEQAGNALAQSAIQRQQLLNETRVNDIYANQYGPALQNIYQKFYALQGKDAVDQLPAYQKEMADLRNQTRENLNNRIVQQLFDKLATQTQVREMRYMSSHASQQQLVYESQTSDALMQHFQDEAVSHWNDPNAVDLAIRSQRAEAWGYGMGSVDGQPDPYGRKGAGQSDPTIQARIQKWTGSTFDAVLTRQALYDPQGAIARYEELKASGALPGSAQEDIERKLKPYMDLLSAQNAYGKVTGGQTAQAIASEAQRQGVDPSTALTIWSAEGGVTNPAIKNPDSSATGIFQHIDSTWKAQGGATKTAST